MAIQPAISDVISQSPLTLLGRHAAACADCVDLVRGYFTEAQAGRWLQAGDVREELCRLEWLADELKENVRSNLPRGLWLSVSRADLLELVRLQDKMANYAKHATGISLGRQLAFPSSISDGIFEYIDVVAGAGHEVVGLIGATRDLSRSAFGSKQTQTLLGLVRGIEATEKESDNIQARLRSELLVVENDLSPIDAIFLYQMLSDIGEIADAAEKVAHRVQIIASS